MNTKRTPQHGAQSAEPSGGDVARAPQSCPLCEGTGGERIWADALVRVILVDEPPWPGFTRVVLQRHVPEMTELPAHERAHVMQCVWRVEAVQRALLAPAKINVASLGNMVPHVHWHVIPRWRDDACFPDAVWAPPRRADGRIGDGATRARELLSDYRQALHDEFLKGMTQ